MDAPRDVLHGTADDSIENEDTHDNLIHVNVSHSGTRTHLLPVAGTASVLTGSIVRSPGMHFSEQQSVAFFQRSELAQHQIEAQSFQTRSNGGAAEFARGDCVRRVGASCSLPDSPRNCTASSMPMPTWGLNAVQPPDAHRAPAQLGLAAVTSGEHSSLTPSALLQHTVGTSHNPLSSNVHTFSNVHNKNVVGFNGEPVPSVRKKRVSFGPVTIISITPRTSQEPASYSTYAPEDAQEEVERAGGVRGGTSSSQCLFESQTQQLTLYSYSVPPISALELTPEAVASDDSSTPFHHFTLQSPQHTEGPPHPDDGGHVVGSERSAAAKFLNFLIADDNPLSPLAGDSAADTCTSITNTMFPTSVIGSDARLAPFVSSSSNDLMLTMVPAVPSTRQGAEEGLAADEQQRLNHTLHVGGDGRGDSTAMAAHAVNKEEVPIAAPHGRGVFFSSEHQEASFAQFEVLGMSDATVDSDNAEESSQRKRKQRVEGASNEGSTLVGKKRGPKPVIPAKHSNAKNPWTLSKRYDTSERDAFVSVTPGTDSSGNAKERRRGASVLTDEAVWLDVDSDTNHEAETASPTGDRVVKIMSALGEGSAMVVLNTGDAGGGTVLTSETVRKVEESSTLASLESTNVDLQLSLKKETQAPPQRLGSQTKGLEGEQARTALHGQVPLLESSTSLSPSIVSSSPAAAFSGEQGRACSSHSREAVRSADLKTVPLICDLCRSAEVPDARGLLFCVRPSSSSAAPLAPTSSLIPLVPRSFPKPVNASILRPLDAYCVHVSCALWSPEVYYEESTRRHEEEEKSDQHDSLPHNSAVNDDGDESKEAGSWVHIAEAVARGALIKCAICRTYGATIGCVSSSCQRSYHYHCACEAAKTGRVVMDHEGLQLMCHRHANKAKKRHRTGEGEDLQ